MLKSCKWLGAMLGGMLLYGQALGAEVWPAVENAVKTGQKAPNDAAVVISIEDYALLGGAHKVKFAGNDGDGFENFLLKTRGISKSKLHRLNGATKEQMLGELEDAAKEAQGGTLWFYFAGHGAVDPNDKAELLLGSDVPLDSRYQASRAVKLTELQKIAEDSGASRAVFVIDACAVELGERFAAPVAMSIGADQKSVIWKAAEMGQKSQVIEAAEHGAFTYAVLGALRGWADGETGSGLDKKVDLDEADQFVSRFLKEAGVRNQTPQMLKSGAMVLSEGVKESAPSREKINQNKNYVLMPVTETVHSKGDIVYSSILGGTGLALAGVGAYFYFAKAPAAEDDRDAVLQKYANGSMNGWDASDKANDYADDASFDRHLGAVLMVTGAALGIYGAVHWYLSGEEVTREQTSYFYASPLGIQGGFRW